MPKNTPYQLCISPQPDLLRKSQNNAWKPLDHLSEPHRQIGIGVSVNHGDRSLYAAYYSGQRAVEARAGGKLRGNAGACIMDRRWRGPGKFAGRGGRNSAHEPAAKNPAAVIARRPWLTAAKSVSPRGPAPSSDPRATHSITGRRPRNRGSRTPFVISITRCRLPCVLDLLFIKWER